MKRANGGFLEADGHSDSRKPSPTAEVAAKPDGCEAAVPAKQSGTASYFAHRKVNAVLAIACCAALVVLFVLALGAGRAGVAPSDVVGILANALLGTGASYSDMATNIVLNVRLPRVVAALLIGAALAISGASYQGLFRNPMVSPDILGASAGASFGAALALLWNFDNHAVQVMAFIMGFIAVGLTYFSARSIGRGGSQILLLVLCGLKWGAATLHPELFSDLDINSKVKDFYKTYLNYSLTDSDVELILAAKNPA